MAAGTGKTMDWTLAAENRQMLKIPMFLAGGLKVENASQAVAQIKPYGYERALFLDALQELLSPEDDARYIIVRKSLLLKKFRREDYHAVPEIIVFS
jgi:hypothetical protein